MLRPLGSDQTSFPSLTTIGRSIYQAMSALPNKVCALGCRIRAFTCSDSAKQRFWEQQSNRYLEASTSRVVSSHFSSSEPSGSASSLQGRAASVASMPNPSSFSSPSHAGDRSTVESRQSSAPNEIRQLEDALFAKANEVRILNNEIKPLLGQSHADELKTIQEAIDSAYTKAVDGSLSKATFDKINRDLDFSKRLLEGLRKELAIQPSIPSASIKQQPASNLSSSSSQKTPTHLLEKREYSKRPYIEGQISPQKRVLREVAWEMSGIKYFNQKSVTHNKRDRNFILQEKKNLEDLESKIKEEQNPRLKEVYEQDAAKLRTSIKEDEATLLSINKYSIKSAHQGTSFESLGGARLQLINQRNTLAVSGEWDKERYGNDPVADNPRMTEEELGWINTKSEGAVHAQAENFAREELGLEPPKANPAYAMPPRKAKPKSSVRFAEENVAHVIIGNPIRKDQGKSIRIPMNESRNLRT